MTQQEILAATESCGRQIDEIIVHCSATREGRDFSAADIRRWHVADRHFSDIGYHFVVRLDGSIEVGRPLRRSGAHCRAHNRRSVGVCYIGGPAPRLSSRLHPRSPRLRPQSLPLLPRHLRILLAVAPATALAVKHISASLGLLVHIEFSGAKMGQGIGGMEIFCEICVENLSTYYHGNLTP